MGRDPCNTQVELFEKKIYLLDAEGVFFSVAEQDEMSDIESSEEEEHSEPDVSHELGWYERELAKLLTTINSRFTEC